MKPEEVLAEAAAVIERDGWHQGDYHQNPIFYNDDDETAEERLPRLRYENWLAARTAPVCSLGAIARVLSEGDLSSPGVETYDDDDRPVYEDPLFMQAAKLLVEANGIERAGFAYADDVIPDWNDDENTTKEDVLLAFKRAANHD